MLPDNLRAYIDSRREANLAGLMELIRFPSVSSQSDRNADSLACVERIAEILHSLGFAAELHPWRSHPVLIARNASAGADAPTVLVYGHYDVQPPEPLEQWDSPPFEPTVRDGALYARGANDDKGQLYAHLAAMEATMTTAGRLPVNVILLAEGEEEIGSPDLERFIADHAGEMRADFAVISDSDFFRAGLPTLCYGLRGLAYVELTLAGPSGDLHSGLHGGVVVNPLNALARMIAAMHDESGRVTLPGFYDDVLPLEATERALWDTLPFDEGEYAAALGVEPVGGERGVDLLTRRWARPTLDCNGIVGGYQGEGSKTVIPARATAKISMRLVEAQRPERIVAGFKRFVAANTPAGVTASVEVFAEARPVLTPIDSPAVTSARAALSEAFNGEVAMVRNGASVPITELFQRILGVDPILMGFGLPTDNLHAPNEHFQLDQFYRGIVAAAAMLHNLAVH